MGGEEVVDDNGGDGDVSVGVDTSDSSDTDTSDTDTSDSSHIIVVIVPIDGGTKVNVSFQHLHPDLARMFRHRVRDWDPLTQEVLHRIIMSNVRGMLCTLAYVDMLQRRLERHARAIRRATGCAPHCRRLVDPLVLHDVNTLFLGCVRAVTTGTPTAWVELGECERCGQDAWGATCTPPRFTRDEGLARDACDHLVFFCWTCLARRDLTHKAPQYVV